MSTVRVANAPVSFGAFEVTVGRVPGIPSGREVARAVAEAGYDGIDLGPVGYLGTDDALVATLRDAGLDLAGGYVPLPLSGDDVSLEAAFAELDRILGAFDAVADLGQSGVPPRLTLADSGSPGRAARPGRAWRDRSVGLDDDGWKRVAESMRRAVGRCRERGYQPTFHHHVGTHVEAPWEIERLLDVSDVGLCLDTGHLLIGGGDPVAAVRDWGSRIDHVHIKDVRRAVVDAVIEESAPLYEVWSRGAFVALGTGDLDVDSVLAELRRLDYGGWVVVEQDRIPEPETSLADVAREQAENRGFLRARGI